MSQPESTMNEQPLTRDEQLALKNRRTLVTAFQMTWILAFVCLVVVCLQIRGTVGTLPGWTALQFGVALAATGGLLLSGWTARRALRGLKRGDKAAFQGNWRNTVALGAAFVVVMIAIFYANPYDGQYLAIFRVMIGYHIVHALAIGAWMVQVYRNYQAGAYTIRDHWGVESALRLWDFVIVAWVLFYVVLYLI
jgi:cytochrome c oxidase subunit 3